MNQATATIESCTCSKCVAICENPGWMTPEEAAAAIAANLGPRLMADWLEPCGELGNDERVYILCPASIGHEGGDAREFDWFELFSMLGGAGPNKGRCNFLTSDNRCMLHDTPHKPKQCRESFGCKSDGPDNYVMGRLWNNEVAQALVEKLEEVMPMMTQYDEDLRAIEPPSVVQVILRDDDVLVYATWTGTGWSVFKLDIALGTCQTSVAEYASANESRQAHMGGLIIYGRTK